ncbi:MAG: MBL fold metallo-hydrolase [Bacteroidetes bacterium]|nr:MAG: MBL fold metallo-hydrolase [Bacteroidota bacterium]
MQLTFWGAARQVTGSMFLLDLKDGYRILIDCGIDMERERFISTTTPRPLFPFDASTIDLVLLTHAHIDHSGNIPNLIAAGFDGQILCTSPTYDLSYLLLMDSAGIHRKKLAHFQKQKDNFRGRRRQHDSFQKPYTADLYLEKQVEDATDRFVPIAFDKPFQVRKDVTITFIVNGHLLGAAAVKVEVNEDNQSKSIIFSGDTGRLNYPLLCDPATLPKVDYLVCETTYGNRNHISSNPEQELEKVITKACVEIPGRLIIPAFSVGRTQALLYTLNKLYISKKLPPIKVFSDSPLALQSTRIHQKYHQYLNQESQDFYKKHGNLFDFENLIYVQTLKESRQISNHNEPCIIISSSGMMEGGRIQHHVKANLENPYCTILLIGYSTEGTLANRLIHGEKVVQIGRKKKIDVKAAIAATDAFSGHGGHDDLMRFIKSQKADELKKLFLVHGEYSSMLQFEADLRKDGYQNVEIPEKGQTYEL